MFKFLKNPVALTAFCVLIFAPLLGILFGEISILVFPFGIFNLLLPGNTVPSVYPGICKDSWCLPNTPTSFMLRYALYIIFLGVLFRLFRFLKRR